MNLQEYKDQRVLYEEFAEKVADICNVAIDAAIKNGPHNYKLQQIIFRAKSISSLEKRLCEKELTDSNEIEKHFEDLAGCRIIFYYNQDVDNLIAFGVIRQHFKIIRAKTHFPGE